MNFQASSFRLKIDEELYFFYISELSRFSMINRIITFSHDNMFNHIIK